MTQGEFIEAVAQLRAQMLRQALGYQPDGQRAEDVVQEALMKLWLLRDQMDGRTKMEHLASVVVRNLSLNALRDEKRRATVTLDDVAPPTTGTDAHRQMEERESMQRLRDAIRRLPDKQRTIIRMRNVERLSYSEIAQILGTTESSVRGLVSRARATIMKQIKTIV